MSEKRTRRSQTERKNESQREIIRAAIKVLSKQGFLRTTLNEIGDEAGYTGGLISHRFGSKTGLVRAVIENIHSRFSADQLIPSLPSNNPKEALRVFIDVYLSEANTRETNIRALYVIMGEALAGEEEIHAAITALNRGFRTQLAEIISHGVASGDFDKDIDPNQAAVLTMGMLRGIVMQYLFDTDAIDIPVVIPLIQRTIIAGLTRHV